MDIVKNISTEIVMDYERPKWFEGEGWGSCTRHGMVYKLFRDEEKQIKGSYEEALEVVKTIIRTGQPPSGGWK